MSLKVNGILIKPTLFPDNTSQIWKLPDEILEADEFQIEFEFEHEGEIFQLQQLNTLLKHGRVPCKINLYMPYLPYGRQDKEVSNETTFALITFAKIINGMRFSTVATMDAHSSKAEELFDNFHNFNPNKKIKMAHDCISDFEEGAYNTILAYPDLGAALRYNPNKDHSCIIGSKVRDQATGYITDYKIKGKPTGKTVLIVDDICDGGMTFKLMADELYKQGAQEVHLYVSHGIFSKGLKTLRASGIQRIFTKEGEVYEKDGTIVRGRIS